VSPSSIAHAKLGVLLEQEGRTEEAIVHFREAVRLNPDNAFAHNNWGIALGQRLALRRGDRPLRRRRSGSSRRTPRPSRTCALTRMRITNPLGTSKRSARSARLARGKPPMIRRES